MAVFVGYMIASLQQEIPYAALSWSCRHSDTVIVNSMNSSSIYVYSYSVRMTSVKYLTAVYTNYLRQSPVDLRLTRMHVSTINTGQVYSHSLGIQRQVVWKVHYFKTLLPNLLCITALTNGYSQKRQKS